MSWFEKNPKKTIIVVVSLIFFLFILISEYSLKKFMGLGNPILYDSNPLYGYRPLSDQEVSRFYGSKIKINNLGIRADSDWDTRIDNKILFLGDSITYGGSYISNEKLFSSVAIKDIQGYKSGNAGVNAWGVENIYGLIVETNFLPAKIYVTTLSEDDFYRGLTRLQGQPFWSHKPEFALQELIYFFYYRKNTERYKKWQTFTSSAFTEKVIEKAVLKLQELDNFLKLNGFSHLIYISPTKAQVLDAEEKDITVLKYLKKYNLNITYLTDKIKIFRLDNKEKTDLFKDDWHLEEKGHAIWGKIINTDLKNLLRKPG